MSGRRLHCSGPGQVRRHVKIMIQQLATSTSQQVQARQQHDEGGWKLHCVLVSITITSEQHFVLRNIPCRVHPSPHTPLKFLPSFQPQTRHPAPSVEALRPATPTSRARPPIVEDGPSTYRYEAVYSQDIMWGSGVCATCQSNPDLETSRWRDT
jgi:hypothetical protein